MKCTICGRDNPATTVYCTGCGTQLNLSAEDVAASVRGELSFERTRSIEHAARTALAFAIAIAIPLAYLENQTSHLPDPDLLPLVPLPAPPKITPSVLDFDEEGIRPLPALESPPYIKPEAHMVKKVINELQEKVFSMNNVILHLKNPPGAKRQGRIIEGEDDEYYYIVDSFTKRENKIKKDEVKEVERVEK